MTWLLSIALQWTIYIKTFMQKVILMYQHWLFYLFNVCQDIRVLVILLAWVRTVVWRFTQTNITFYNSWWQRYFFKHKYWWKPVIHVLKTIVILRNFEIHTLARFKIFCTQRILLYYFKVRIRNITLLDKPKEGRLLLL